MPSAGKAKVLRQGWFESDRSFAIRVMNACPGTTQGAKARSNLKRMDRDRRDNAKKAQEKVKKERRDKEKRDKERKARGAKKEDKSSWW